MSRWRGRIGGLTIAAAIVGVLAAQAAAIGSDAPLLVVRGPDGADLARVELPDGTFTLRYRNSLYGSLVEERFTISTDGRLHLTGLAADELAVLEEYYAIDRPAGRAAIGSQRNWEAMPAVFVEEETLLVAATDLGERTLLIDGAPPIELWRLVDDANPSVWLEIDR